MGITFSLTVFAWIFFRAADVTHAFSYISEIFSSSLFTMPRGVAINKIILLLSVLFFIVEWIGREQQYAIADLGLRWKRPFRWLMYYVILFLIIWYTGKEQEFIYFQF